MGEKRYYSPRICATASIADQRFHVVPRTKRYAGAGFLFGESTMGWSLDAMAKYKRSKWYIPPHRQCPVCGKTKSSGSVRCRACRSKMQSALMKGKPIQAIHGRYILDCNWEDPEPRTRAVYELMKCPLTTT